MKSVKVRNGLKIDEARSLLEHLRQKMEMWEKENERQQGIHLWKHIEYMSENSIAEIQDKMELVFTFIHRYGYSYGLNINAAESMLNRLKQKKETWKNMDNSGIEELGENKSILLQQVKRVEDDVSMGMMSQDAFVTMLKGLLGHYRDLRIEDYRGWINEDSYNKLIESVF